jgi:hypothetical protein
MCVRWLLVNLGLFDARLELRLVAVLIGFWMGSFSSWPLPISRFAYLRMWWIQRWTYLFCTD